MAHVYVFSPAGAVTDRSGLRRGVKRLEAMGHQVEIDPSTLVVHQRFAGTDDERVAAFERAAASGADWALITRGGYGLTRIIHRLPYAAIGRAIRRGMQWMGYSDFTAFQCGLWQAKGQGSWAGPSVMGDLGAETVNAITLACFSDTIDRSSEGTGWRLKPADWPMPGPTDQQWARGATLWGGNLCVLTSLLGTPHFPAIRHGALFLEDVGEHPYRIERMLTQLHLAGVLDDQQVILLGAFTQYQTVSFDRGFNMRTVVEGLRARTRTPVFTGLPFGHAPTKVCLPFGTRVDVATQGKEALILWGEMH